jgi:hypothetical protein
VVFGDKADERAEGVKGVDGVRVDVGGVCLVGAVRGFEEGCDFLRTLDTYRMPIVKGGLRECVCSGGQRRCDGHASPCPIR